jgi:hypothetical protein
LSVSGGRKPAPQSLPGIPGKLILRPQRPLHPDPKSKCGSGCFVLSRFDTPLRAALQDNTNERSCFSGVSGELELLCRKQFYLLLDEAA